MPLNLKKDDMGDVIKDFYKSKAPQFKGKSKKKRREMAIAAKLTAERGPLPEYYGMPGGMGSSASKKLRADYDDEEYLKRKDKKDRLLAAVRRGRKKKVSEATMEKPLSAQEIALQKKKMQIDMQILKKRKQSMSDMKNEEVILEKSPAWTRKAGKNKEGGLNEKGRKSYERENPGSDLKAPSKKVGNKRRASFCARMKGMKKKLTSAKTANDPDSRINKSLRAWNC